MISSLISSVFFFLPKNVPRGSISKPFHLSLSFSINYHLLFFGFFLKSQLHFQIILIPHANKVMLLILQTRLQQYVNWEFLDVQI